MSGHEGGLVHHAVHNSDGGLVHGPANHPTQEGKVASASAFLVKKHREGKAKAKPAGPTPGKSAPKKMAATKKKPLRSRTGRGNVQKRVSAGKGRKGHFNQAGKSPGQSQGERHQ